MTGVPPPPGLVWEDESPAPAGGPRPSLGQPPAGLVWEDELRPLPAPRNPSRPRRGLLPDRSASSGRASSPAGGSALRPGSLQPQVIQPGNPLREAMLGASGRPAERRSRPSGRRRSSRSGAAAAPPMPEIPLRALRRRPAAQGGGRERSPGNPPGLIAGAARFVPETAMRLRRGVTDEMADAIGATEVQRRLPTTPRSG